MTRQTKTAEQRAKEALDRATRVETAAGTKADRLEADAKAAREAADVAKRRREFLATDPDLPAEPVRRTRTPRPSAPTEPAPDES